MAEDLALEQRVGDCRAIERHERMRRARAQLVDGLRDQLLTGARLAEDQHRGGRRRRLLQHLIEGAHRGTVADDPPEAATIVELPAQRLVLALVIVELGEPLEQALQLIGIERLGQVVLGAALDGLDRGVDGPLRRQQDDLDVFDLGWSALSSSMRSSAASPGR